MSSIQENLEEEHQRLLRDREEELAALKQQVHKLGTAVLELQQQQQQLKQQQQDWLARILSCSWTSLPSVFTDRKSRDGGSSGCWLLQQRHLAAPAAAAAVVDACPT
ncbi:hypothetical protein ACSSS7_007848 [Eimeria intestinalis]